MESLFKQARSNLTVTQPGTTNLKTSQFQSTPQTESFWNQEAILSLRYSTEQSELATTLTLKRATTWLELHLFRWKGWLTAAGRRDLLVCIISFPKEPFITSLSLPWQMTANKTRARSKFVFQQISTFEKLWTARPIHLLQILDKQTWQCLTTSCNIKKV